MAADDDLFDTESDETNTPDTADDDLGAITDAAFDGLTDDDVEAEGEGEATDDAVDTGGEALDDDGAEGAEQEPPADGQPRDEKGKFAAKPGANDAKGAPTDKVADKTAEKAAAPAAAAVTDATPPSKPEVLNLRVDKAIVPLEEVQMVKANGNTFLAIKDQDFPAFQQRLVRGIAAERMWRQLNDGLRELELKKAAPTPKSDAEIEAEITLEALKPRLAELLDDQQMENLELKVKLAQKDARETFATNEKTRIADAEKAEREKHAGAEEERQVYEAIAQEMLAAVEAHPDLKAALTSDDLKAVFAQLDPLKRSIFWKDGTQWYKNSQLVLDHLKAKAAGRQAPTSAPSKEPHAGNATPTDTKADASDRFNRGQDSAATPNKPKPATTSVKAQRGTPRPRDERPHRAPRTNTTTKTAAMAAEDQARATIRKYLNAPGLDVPDDDEG